jgi:hypothetical protein
MFRVRFPKRTCTLKGGLLGLGETYFWVRVPASPSIFSSIKNEDLLNVLSASQKLQKF